MKRRNREEKREKKQKIKIAGKKHVEHNEAIEEENKKVGETIRRYMQKSEKDNQEGERELVDTEQGERTNREKRKEKKGRGRKRKEKKEKI